MRKQLALLGLILVALAVESLAGSAEVARWDGSVYKPSGSYDLRPGETKTFTASLSELSSRYSSWTVRFNPPYNTTYTVYLTARVWLARQSESYTVPLRGSASVSGSGSATVTYDASSGSGRYGPYSLSANNSGTFSDDKIDLVAYDVKNGIIYFATSVSGSTSPSSFSGTLTVTNPDPTTTRHVSAGFFLTVGISITKPDSSPLPSPSKTPTKLRLNATGAGYNVQLVARLTDNDGNPLSGKTIYFYYSYDNKTWTQIGTNTTNTNGYAYMRHTTTKPTYYKASFQGDSSYEPSEAYAFYSPPIVINLGLGTMHLPGEGIATPWLENMSGWSWEGTWLLNVTELYPVKEHIAMILTDGSNVKVVDLPNGTSIRVYLPAGWKNNKYVKSMGQARVTQIPLDRDTLAKTFPSVTINGQTWFLVALAAWNPYKQPSGYDTSCWLSNGTTLAVYNLTYTYTFKNGTRVVFKEPVVVSTLKTSAMPIYSIGDMKQGLSLQVTVKWKYLPPARTGIQPQPPSSIVGVAVIGDKVYNGTLIDANATSKTFLITITNDTWTLYSKGVTSVTASAYWLSSMGTPEGPVALQDPAQLNIVYVMLSFVYTIQRNFDESKIDVDNP